MLVYPYELNGRQLYQDAAAGQGYSAERYDVAKYIFFPHTASALLHPKLTSATHTEGIKSPPLLSTTYQHLQIVFCQVWDNPF